MEEFLIHLLKKVVSQHVHPAAFITADSTAATRDELSKEGRMKSFSTVLFLSLAAAASCVPVAQVTVDDGEFAKVKFVYFFQLILLKDSMKPESAVLSCVTGLLEEVLQSHRWERSIHQTGGSQPHDKQADGDAEILWSERDRDAEFWNPGDDEEAPLWCSRWKSSSILYFWRQIQMEQNEPHIQVKDRSRVNTETNNCTKSFQNYISPVFTG